MCLKKALASGEDGSSPISLVQSCSPGEGRRAPLRAIPCPKAPPCKGSWLPLGRLRGCSSKRPRSGLPAWWGRFPLGVPFARSKGTKTRLGRSPLRTSLGYEAGPASCLYSARWSCCGSCSCHHTRPPWAAGPMAGRFPCPGLLKEKRRSRRREPYHR